jgi:hypothetical protein
LVVVDAVVAVDNVEEGERNLLLQDVVVVVQDSILAGVLVAGIQDLASG